MFNKLAKDLFRNLFAAESDLNQPLNNSISTRSTSSASSLADDLDINPREDRIEQVDDVNRPLRELLAPD